MIERIKNLLKPPTFVDETDNRVAQTLNVILWLMLLGSVATVAAGIYFADNNVITPFVILGIITIISLFIMRQNNLTIPSILLPTFFLIIISFIILSSGDVFRDSASHAYVMIIVLAGLLLGRRGVVFYTALSVVAMSTIGYLEISGVYSSNFDKPPSGYDIFITNLIIVFSGLFLYVLVNNLNKIIQVVREREAEVAISNQALEKLSASLEERIKARTTDLALAAEIGQNVAQLQNLETLLATAVDLIQVRFNLYYVQIYLLEEDSNELVLHAGTGEVGRELLSRHHRLSLEGTSINGKAVLTKQAQLVPDTVASPDFKANDLLTRTRSEMSVPLLVGANAIGVLNLQSEIAHALTEDVLPAFEIIAGQLAIAINNANLFTERQQITISLREAQTRTQTILEAITLPMVISRVSDGMVFYVNEPLAQTIQIPVTELAGHQTPDFYNDPAERQQFLAEFREKGGVDNYQLRLKRADGTLFWALVSGRLINYQGEPSLIIVLVDITDQYEAQATVTKQAKELSAVARIGTVAASILDANEMLQEVISLIKARFTLYHAHIYLLDDSGENLVLTAGAGEIGKKMAAEGRSIPIARPQSLVARAARTKQGVIINDVRAEPGFLPNPLLPDTRSEMAVPLIAGNTLLGVLDVQSDTLDYFTEEDINIQTTLSAQIATALQNARQYVTTQVTLAETELLYNISARLNAAQTPDEILQATILPGLNAEATSANLFTIDVGEDGEPEWLELASNWRIDGQTPYPIGTRFYLPDYPGALGWVKTSNPQVIGDIANDPDLDAAAKAVYEQINAKATVTLPLKTGGQWVGAISISWDEMRTFSHADMRFYQALAEQSAIMFNTQLLIQRTQKRARDLATVADVGAASIKELDAGKLLQTVVDLTKEQFDLYHTHIYLYDDTNQTLSLSAGAGDVGKKLVAQGHRIPIGREQSLVARAARTRAAVIVNDVHEDPGFMANPLLPDTRSEMAVPLVAGDVLMGVMDVQSTQTGRFSDDDAMTQMTLASQVAVALQNDQQYEQTALALADANLFRQFIEESGQGIGWADMNGRVLYMNRSLMNMLEIDSIEDALLHNSFEFYPEETEKFLLETVVPIVLEEGSWLGEIMTEGKNGQLLPTLHNLFLVRDAEGKGRYLGNVITDITDRKKAEEEQQKLAREMEEQITQINALQRAMIHEGWEAFFTAKDRLIQGYMFDAPNLSPMLAGDLMTHGGMQMSVDLSSVSQSMKDEMGTAVATPMRVRGEVIGVLGARHPDGEPLSEDQQAILDALSEQVAEALERTRLFEETELGRQQLNQRANELQAVAEITTAISSLLDEQQLLETVTYMTQRRFDLYHCHIFLLDESQENLQIRACSWEEGDPHEGTHGDAAIPFNEKNSLVAQAAREQQTVMVNDVRNDPRWRPSELLPKTQSEMAVPLIAGGQVIGVLDVQAEQLNRFTEEDVRIQMTLAAQVGVALQNARQYMVAQRRANRERLINEISQKIQGASTIEGALQTAVSELGQALKVRRALVELNTTQKENGQ